MELEGLRNGLARRIGRDLSRLRLVLLPARRAIAPVRHKRKPRKGENCIMRAAQDAGGPFGAFIQSTARSARTARRLALVRAGSVDPPDSA